MIATSTVKSVKRTTSPSPDLNYFRQHYPQVVMNFGGLPDRELWLRRIWELDARWQKAMADGSKSAEEAIVRGAPPSHLTAQGSFDIIYAGGVLGLLHAAVLATQHGRRVLVFDAHAIGRASRDWNISDEELAEFERAGLFTKEEIERAVVNRYERGGFVKFHDRGSRIKADPLWIKGVLDVAVDADKLLALAANKLRSREGCALMDEMRFVRCYVEPHRVSVEVEDARGARRLFDARLFVDATGANSPVARQINEGRAMTHVCPTVGTVARGFTRGEAPDRIDFKTAEILVSTEDACDHRQLIWEGFAGSPTRDEYTTCLFFYDAVDSPADKSLLSLFESYFESLPKYKRAGAQWRVVKPAFGYVPSFHRQGWKERKRTAAERVLLIGDAGGLSSPLTFCGFGSHARNLRRLTHLTALALDADLLDESSLSEITAHEPRVAQMVSLAEFLRPAARSAPSAVNETLNAVMTALGDLDERVRRQFFQDRMTFNALRSLLGRTAKVYPRIFQRVREHLGARGTFWWLANIAEAVLNERRGRTPLPAHEEASEDARQRFARHVALYRKEQDAGAREG